MPKSAWTFARTTWWACTTDASACSWSFLGRLPVSTVRFSQWRLNHWTLFSLPVLRHPYSLLPVLPTDLLPLSGPQLSQVRPQCDYRVLHISFSWGATARLSGLGSHSMSLLLLFMFPFFSSVVVSGEDPTGNSNSIPSSDLLWTNLLRLAACPDFQELPTSNSQWAQLTFWHNLPLNLEHLVPTVQLNGSVEGWTPCPCAFSEPLLLAGPAPPWREVLCQVSVLSCRCWCAARKPPQLLINLDARRAQMGKCLF